MADAIKQLPPLHPNQIIRKNEGRKYFGYGPTQTDEKIKSGELPPTFPLSDSGRAEAWTGQQILDHQAGRLRLAAAKRG
jgi:predicted DNA-binding transcriptional regulator AlpA